MSKRAYRGWLWASAFALLATATMAQARTLTVEEGGRAEFRSIAAAIEAAESGDTIIIEPGTYSGGVTIAGKTLTLRSRDPNDPRVVAGTVLDGSQVFRIGARAGTRVTLAGLTIRDGHSRFDGGAVLLEDADLTVTNCVFHKNTSRAAGGAIYCRNGRASFRECTFSDNTSETGSGGAIYCEGSVLDLANCSFETSTGCALVSSRSEARLTGCTFRGNRGEEGGAIRSRNDDGDFGAVTPRLNLVSCTFTDNAAVLSGGAMSTSHTLVTLEACIFRANTAGQDGGALYHSSFNSNSTLINCVFTGNQAANLGGAISNWYGSNSKITNCTFSGNSAAIGGAVAGKGAGHSRFSHCILWNNRAAQGPSLALLGNAWDYKGKAVATVAYSDLEGGRSGVYAEPDGVLNWASGSNLDADPLFRSATDLSLSWQSPCIDAGDPLYVPDPNMKDLAGNPRQSGATVDMGAYEAGPMAVYRFWSPLTERHFYTISRSERDKLMRDYAYAWTYEGIAFHAYTGPIDDGMVPVHRLWSTQQNSHFWTADEKEMQRLLRESSDLWVYEGIAFFVYPPNKQPWQTVPVHRFWWTTRGGHFYTANEDEKNKLVKNWSKTWVYEGIVWYVFAGPR